VSRVSFRIVAAQTADAATYLVFMLFFAAGSIHHERNPIIVGLMAVGGIWIIAAAKIGDAAWCAWRFDHPPKPSRFARIRALNRAIRIDRWWAPVTTVMLSVAAASGIVGAGFNLASIVSSIR